MRGQRLVQGRCTVGSIRDANHGPRTPLAALIPLLHRAPSCPVKTIMLHGLALLLTATGWVYNVDVGLCRGAAPLQDHWLMGLCNYHSFILNIYIAPLQEN